MITPKDRFDYLARNVRYQLSEARNAIINRRADELSVSDKVLYAKISDAIACVEQKMSKLSEQWLKSKANATHQ